MIKPGHEHANPNPELCAQCGGRCCKSMSCHLSPADAWRMCGEPVGLESLRRLLDEGNVSIDYWSGDIYPHDKYTRVYYLRMRHKGAQVCDPSWGGECILLTPTGCPLTFEQRPRGAQHLIPMEGFKCVSLYTKEQCASDWRPYNKLLERLWEEFKHG